MKKIKELQEDVNKYVCYYRYVKMEKENLQERIDKAIEIIEKHKDYEDEGLLVEETIKLLIKR